MKEEQAHIDYIDDRIEEILEELYRLMEEKHAIINSNSSDHSSSSNSNGLQDRNGKPPYKGNAKAIKGIRK